MAGCPGGRTEESDSYGFEADSMGYQPGGLECISGGFSFLIYTYSSYGID